MSKKNTANKSWYVFEFEGEFLTSSKKLTKKEVKDCLDRGRIRTDFPEFGVYGGMNLITAYYSSPQWTWKQAEEFANQMQTKREREAKSPAEILADGEADSLYGL